MHSLSSSFSLWPDLAIFRHIGSPLWPSRKCTLNILHNFEQILANFISYWANFNFCKWTNIEQTILPSGHTVHIPSQTHFIYHKHKHFLIHTFSCWAHVGKSLIEVVNFDGGGVANSTHSLWLLSQPPTPSLLLRSTLSVFLPSPFLSFSVCLLSSSQQICHLSVCLRRCLLHLSTNGHYAQE